MGIFLSEILKKELYKLLLQELTNTHPRAEVFSQISPSRPSPHQDQQDAKYPTNARGGMGMLGID